MKKFLAYFLYTLLIAAVACACSNDLDIHQAYSFDLLYTPIPKKIAKGETIEIQCELRKEGDFKQAGYTIRYFQNEGKGSLKLADNRVLSANERLILNLDNNKFSLFYTSLSSDQQVLDIYIEDNFGQVVKKQISFQHENPPSLDFELDILPVSNIIKFGETIGIRCQIKKVDENNDATYSIRYFQSTGKGKLALNNEVLTPNDLYTLNSEGFNLYYTSGCKEKQTINVYVEDNSGQTVQKTFSFDNQAEPEIDTSFELVVLPVPKKIAKGETVEIRCQIKKADLNNNATYFIRYFQPDGKGQLRMDNGTAFLPNDLYPLNKTTFRLYYTSHADEQQTIDVYIVDSTRLTVQKTFSFQDNSNENEEPEDAELMTMLLKPTD